MTRQPHQRTHQHAMALLLTAGNIPAVPPSIHGDASVRRSQPRNPPRRTNGPPHPNNGVDTPTRGA
jgi:hypothetical protein